MKWIKIKGAFGKFKANDLVEVEDAVADAYVATGNAEESTAPTNDALKNLGLEEFQTAVRSLNETVTRTINEAATALRSAGSAHVRIEPGEQQADRTKSIGDFVVQVYKSANINNAEGMAGATKRLTEVYGAKKGMEEGTGSSGGFWTMPTEMSETILAESWNEAIILPRSTNFPLGSRALEIPVLDQYQIPTAGNSAEFAGVTVARKDEKTRRDSSQPKTGKIKLEANDLTAFTSYSRDLNEDSVISLTAYLTTLIGGAIGFRRDYEHFYGTGVGQPLGIYADECKARIDVPRTTTGTVKYQDIAKMLSRLMTAGHKRAFWVAHPFLLETLLTLKDDSNRLIFLPTMTTTEGPVATNPVPRLANLPVLFSEKAPALGSKCDLALIDAKAYLTGQRSGLEIGLSEHFMFDTDQIALRAKIRDDGQPWMKKPIPLADGSGKTDPTKQNYVSPFVGLAA